MTLNTYTLSSIASHSFSIAKSKESLPLCLMSSKCSCSIIPLHHAPLLSVSIVFSGPSILFSSSEESKSCSETKDWKINWFVNYSTPHTWPWHTRLLGITDCSRAVHLLLRTYLNLKLIHILKLVFLFKMSVLFSDCCYWVCSDLFTFMCFKEHIWITVV